MKKKIKKIFLILSIACFLLLIARPAPAYADSIQEKAYQITNDYFEYIELNQQSLLEQFFTYAYVSVSETRQGVETVYDYCLVVSSIDDHISYVTYNTTNGSGYYRRGLTGFIPRSPAVRVYSDHITISGNYYYFDSATYPNQYVIYCDLPTTYYTDYHTSGTLTHVILPFTLPSPNYSGSKSGDFGQIIQDDLDRWNPQPVTILPPFIPPETLPLSTLPLDIVTIYPPATDLDGSYIVNYSPYIYGDFYGFVTTSNNSGLLQKTGGIISYSWDFIKSFSDFYNIILLLMILGIVISLLT